ncbi:TPR-like protein, partial [Gyrodon lividus]
KGNGAFKAADYATAIGHYTNAILANGSDPTYFLNRAAAYLKLGKNEDAERDCTNVLVLSTNNVKALFRRGQARRALGKFDDARADFDHALVLEPANASVKNEILEIEKLQQQKLNQRNKATLDSRPQAASSPTLTNCPPNRRRVPIEIVEIDARSRRDTQVTGPLETKPEALLQPVSSRNLEQENKPAIMEISPPKPQTFVGAKQAREASKPIRVSGGIFRHAGNHTIVTRAQSESTASPQAFTPVPTPIKPPTTLLQFTKLWDSSGSDDDRWSLIRRIPPSSIPALFQVSLEPELLKSILHTLRAILEQDPDPGTRNVVRDYLLAFTKVQRFGTVMLFMDKPERQLLELLREKVNFL